MARHAQIRLSNVRRMPASRSECRSNYSSEMATTRIPGAAWSKYTTSSSNIPANGLGRRRSRRLSLRWKSRVSLEAICCRQADANLGGGHRHSVCLSKLRVEPHLVVVDVATRHPRHPISRSYASEYLTDRSHQKRPPKRAPSPPADPAPGYALHWISRLRFPPRLSLFSHPDCHAAIYRWMVEGKCPKPVQLGGYAFA